MHFARMKRNIPLSFHIRVTSFLPEDEYKCIAEELICIRKTNLRDTEGAKRRWNNFSSVIKILREIFLQFWISWRHCESSISINQDFVYFKSKSVRNKVVNSTRDILQERNKENREQIKLNPVLIHFWQENRC